MRWSWLYKTRVTRDQTPSFVHCVTLLSCNIMQISSVISINRFKWRNEQSELNCNIWSTARPVSNTLVQCDYWSVLLNIKLLYSSTYCLFSSITGNPESHKSHKLLLYFDTSLLGALFDLHRWPIKKNIIQCIEKKWNTFLKIVLTRRHQF